MLFSLLASSVFAFDFSMGGRIGGSYQVPLGSLYTKDLLGMNQAIDPNAKMGLGAAGFKGNIGMYFDFGILPQFSIQPEFSFGFNNAFSTWTEYTETAVDPDYAGTRISTYQGFDSLDFVLLFKGRFPVAKNIRVIVGAGPSVIVPLNYYRTKTETTGPTINTSEKQKVPTALTGPLLGITFDVGAEFDFDKAGYLSLTFRSDWSLTPVFPQSVNNGSTQDSNAGYWHRPVGLFVGYGYRFYDSNAISQQS